MPPIADPDPQMTPDPQQLQAFVSALCKKRDDAVSGRKASGIEQEWLEDEEAYQGIDDANRHLYRGTSLPALAKGEAASAPAKNMEKRSVVLPNIIRPYVDAAAARIADMLLPVDERCWEIKPTPIAEDDPQVQSMLAAEGIGGEQLAQLQAQVQADAEQAAVLMGVAIDDCLVECNWHAEVRGVIEDAARIGTGVLKGPVPKKFTAKTWSIATPSGPLPMRAWSMLKRSIGRLMGIQPELTLQVSSTIKPASVRVDPWNFYPDKSCGEDIQNGGGTWEYANITPKQLRDMADMPGYNQEAIAAILKEGPKPTTSRSKGDILITPPEGQFELWTGYCVIAKEDAGVAGLEVDDETPVIHAMVLMVNDKLIKVALNALDTGEYPYDVLAWQRRPGMPWGSGVARHGRTPQRMVTAATRAMMNNAGQIAKPDRVIGNGVTPADGQWDGVGGKVYRAEPDVVDVRAAFYSYVPPSSIDEFMKIIELGRNLMEQTTGMPMLLQGQQGSNTDTLGGMQLLQNNASGVLRRLAKRFDDYITEPHIRRYYNWQMQYNERQDIKGDFQIDVRASSALIERDSQKQFMFAAMNFATNPAFGIDPFKLFAELAKADRMDPKRIQVDEEMRQKIGAPSIVDQANASLAQAKASESSARAAEAEARTVLANVQALYSAITTANAVAANPAIAPAADATAKSAGFVDKDDPPIVSAVPPGTPVEAMPSNTSPNFPPVAPSPTEGVAVGIEGGQR